MTYCTLAQVKTYLGSEIVTDDALLEDMIDYAQAVIDDTTQKTYEAATDTTRYFDAVKDVIGTTLYFDTPIVSITSITNGDGVAVAAASYVTTPLNDTPYWGVKIKSDQSIYWTYNDARENAITVVGKWAYSLTAPNAIKHACIRLAAFLYRQRDSSSDFDRPVVVEGAMTILPGDLPRDVLRLLAPFMPVTL
jgi:hypothetical protein